MAAALSGISLFSDNHFGLGDVGLALIITKREMSCVFAYSLPYGN
jgi:hypothetical protein